MKPKSVGDFMDAAREMHGLRSDRALARLMGLSQAGIRKWREMLSFPRDEEMQRLARLSGADEGEALLLLNLWRAPDADTRESYRRVLRLLGSSAGAALLAASLSGSPAPAAELQLKLPIVYYGKSPRSSRGRVRRAA